MATKTKSKLADTIIDALYEMDEADLNEVALNLRQRRKDLAQVRAVDIRVGAPIRFTKAIRPTYLAGLTAVVRKKNPQSVAVDCPADPAYGRFAGKANIRCPLALVEVVEEIEVDHAE